MQERLFKKLTASDDPLQLLAAADMLEEEGRLEEAGRWRHVVVMTQELVAAVRAATKRMATVPLANGLVCFTQKHGQTVVVDLHGKSGWTGVLIRVDLSRLHDDSYVSAKSCVLAKKADEQRGMAYREWDYTAGRWKSEA